MFCIHCEKEVSEERVICPCCGRIANEKGIAEVISRQENSTGVVNEKKLTLTEVEALRNKPATLANVAMGFMIIGCVLSALLTVCACAYAVITGFLLWFIFGLFPFAWCLSMTISYCSMIKKRKEISVDEKIFLLLFVNPVAGILMLCNKDDLRQN